MLPLTRSIFIGSFSADNDTITLTSSNSLATQSIHHIKLGKSDDSGLEKEESTMVKMQMHCRNTGQGVLRLLLVYLDVRIVVFVFNESSSHSIPSEGLGIV
jgi:hypothetical protein